MERVTQLNAALADRYEVQREVGAGGMATVYLARDVRHDRSVALKVLNPDLGAVLGVERFLAEIKVTANLQHPNLLPLFDSGVAASPDHGGRTGLLFYVMPFVEGESLRARLDREKQLPVDEALRIAIAVASALEYAHARGVIHRDLKPENILLQAGQPLVADFGIAIAVSNAGGTRITQTGISLGTPQYMSPEQATGDRAIDGRTDIYSLAAVLFEMLTGEPPHLGNTAQAIISRVLTERPRSVRATRSSVPAYVDAAIARALEKLPADRQSNAREFAEGLQGRMDAFHPTMPGVSRSGWMSRVPVWALVVALLVVGGAVGTSAAGWVWGARKSEWAGAPVVRATIELPPETPLILATQPNLGYNSPVVAVSPDGSTLAYVVQTPAGGLVHARNLATGESRALAGTEGAIHAFFSPEGASIGFLTGEHVKKIPSGGGAVIVLCGAKTPVLAWWIQTDLIYFTENEQAVLSRVSADGGKAERVATTGELGVSRFTDVLPGGDGALVSAGGASINGDYKNILFANLRTKETQLVIQSGYGARYVAPGYLLFVRKGNLMAVRFDARRGKASGEPIPLTTGTTAESIYGILHAAASSNGVLAYVPGGDMSVGKLAWVDRRNTVEFLDVPEQTYGSLDLASDGQRIAVHATDVKDYIWVWNIARHEGQRVPSQDAEGSPKWSPDRRWLAGGLAGNPPRATVHEVDPNGRIGDGVPLTAPGVLALGAFSPTGDVVAVMRSQSPFQYGFIGMGKSATASPLIIDAGFVGFSPDGRWIVYTSDVRTGANEVFIASYPDGKVVGQVSTAGGGEPRWEPTGDLYFRSGHRWYVTRVSLSPQPSWDQPRLVFDVEFIDTPGLSYDVTPDGQRLLVVKRVRPVTTNRIDVISNWVELMERRR